MSDDLERPGQWRDEIETRLGTLEATVEELPRLRAAMDEDMGDLKAQFGAQKKLIQAVHDTQSDHTERLTTLETEVRELREDMRSGFEQVHVKFDRVNVGLQTIHDLLVENLNSSDN